MSGLFASQVDFTDCDLTDVDLSHSRLSEFWLNRAKLNNTKFCYASLYDVYLHEEQYIGTVDFSNAFITCVSIKNQSTENIKLNQTLYIPEYSDWIKKHKQAKQAIPIVPAVNLRGISLVKKDFSSQDLPNSDFSQANLQTSRFDDCNLTNCNFAGADLTSTDFTYANLTGCNFQQAQVTDICLNNATLQNTDLENTVPPLN